MPTYLYQYTKSKHAEDVLNDDLMFLRAFDDLNDPFDGDFLGGDDEVHVIQGVELKDGSYHVEVTVYKMEIDWDYKKQYKVACFTESNYNAPMWSFYGDNHKGICVEYSFLENPLFELFCYPIQYVESTDNNDLVNKLVGGKDPLNREIMEIFVKKSESWSYEQEWRIVINDKMPFKWFEFESREKNKYLKFFKPTSVYLGLKLDDEDTINRIMDICNERGINVFKMIKDDSGYNLISKPVNND